METIVDTELTWGTLFYPIRPPTTSMLVFVKATFALDEAEEASLAVTQDPLTGPLHHEDDPECSLRYPNEYALIKPKGECFLTGSVRALGDTPIERTAVRFSVGPVDKTLAVYGARHWVRSGIRMVPSAPIPFTELPLVWEHAFGGRGFDANPHGVGLDPSPEGVIALPHFEHPNAPMTDRDQRPEPAGAFPWGPNHPDRRQRLGTYDEQWQQTRYPWLAEDFQIGFFNQAPADQRIDGFWTGREAIRLSNLHPRLSSVSTRLPGLRARAFVEHEAESRRAGSFQEVPLALDMITVDVDRGLALCVWRGTVDLDHDALLPDGIARLFIMDEPDTERSSVAACERRMHARIAADQASQTELSGETPPTSDPPINLMGTIAAPPSAALAAAIAAATEAEAPEGVDPDALLAKVKADLCAAGLDPEAVEREAARAVPFGPMAPPDIEKLRGAFASMGQDVPPEVEEALALLASLSDSPPAPHRLVEPLPEDDLRTRVIQLHRARQPLVGDFSGVNLSELSLPGLDASRAILIRADLRGANLERANLTGTNLTGAELYLARLTKANLQDADLTGALLEAADLSGANLDGATLEAAEAVEVKLDGATLRKADLSRAILSEASLVGSVCDEADFGGARLEKARCIDASFVETRLYGVRAAGVVMDRADLTRIRVGRGADPTEASFKGTRATGSRWRDATLDRAVFAGAVLDGADFTNAALVGADLSGCPLRRAVFQNAKVVETQLAYADLFEGSFREADLSRADLRGANLYSADFFRARAEGVNLADANLKRTAWDRA